MRNRVMMLMIICVWALFLCPVAVFAGFEEDYTNPGTDKIVVDKEDNSIYFVYDESDEEMMSAWQEEQVFFDIPADSDYQLYVTYLSQLGIMEGIENNLFSPDSIISVSELLGVIRRIVDEQSYLRFLDIAAVTQLTGLETITKDDALCILLELAWVEGNDLYLDFCSEPSLQNCNGGNSLLNTTDNNSFNRTTLTRGETAKLITAYIMLRDKPVIYFPETGPLQYIDEDTEDHNLLTDGCALVQINNGNMASINWTGMSTPNAHEMVTDQGYTILYHDKNSSITNLSGKLSPTARGYIRTGCTAPDYDAVSSSPGANVFKNHYCSPDLENSHYETSTSAYTRMNDEYYLAKVYYTNQNYSGAYNKLGRSIHYFEDINSPPHAALVTGTYHHNYENWVRDNWISSYLTTSSTSAFYDNIKYSTFQSIAITFSTMANNNSSCIYSYAGINSGTAQYQTMLCLHNAEKGVAGLLYRYLYDTNRLN